MTLAGRQQQRKRQWKRTKAEFLLHLQSTGEGTFKGFTYFFLQQTFVLNNFTLDLHVPLLNYQMHH